MANFQSNNFYERSRDDSQKKFNLVEASKEKLGLKTSFEKAPDWELADYQNMTAPTINPPKPRAKKIAYSKSMQKLVIKFRDGTWWEYNEVPPEMWNDLKSSDSTGRYLRNSGLDTHDNMGPFNPSAMSPEVRVLFNS